MRDDEHHKRLSLLIISVVGMILMGMAITRGVHAETMCVPIEIPRDIAIKRGAHWMGLTPERYRFLEGIYAMAPWTPPGLPPGDAAFLSWKDGDDVASVWFIDGQMACGQMAIPQVIVDMMQHLYEVKHVGDGL